MICQLTIGHWEFSCLNFWLEGTYDLSWSNSNSHGHLLNQSYIVHSDNRKWVYSGMHAAFFVWKVTYLSKLAKDKKFYMHIHV